MAEIDSPSKKNRVRARSTSGPGFFPVCGYGEHKGRLSVGFKLDAE